MIVLLVKIQAKPEMKNELQQRLQSFVPLAQREPGCVQYELFVDTVNTNVFYFFEKWIDEASLKVHSEKEYLKNFRMHEEKFFAAPMQVDFLRMVEAE